MTVAYNGGKKISYVFTLFRTPLLISAHIVLAARAALKQNLLAIFLLPFVQLSIS
jgi:hypothetical protein